MNKYWKLGILVLVLVALVQTQSPHQAAEGKLALEVLPRATVTVLVDNMAGSGPVLGEWGVAFLIETDQHQILFDTGGGRVLLGNARALDVKLGKTEAIVISHEHEDHTGGLRKVLHACGPVDVFVHPFGFETRYWKEDSGAVAHRLPLSRQQLSRQVRKLIETRELTAVRKGVMVTGQIPRVNDFEDTGLHEFAFSDENLKIPDPILDDQAVFFRAPEGVVILLGCGHAGLVNTMRYVSELVGEHRIYAVIGGTHLLSASPVRIQKTIEALKKYDVQKIMLSHCTGVQAYAELAGALPGRCTWPASGTRIQFGGQ
jgi:7,8-dihydropterin-6-yl-methyl-4-(beta-D-ribofuranosyl)aminobenzene 5'-phosphate synthase